MDLIDLTEEEQPTSASTVPKLKPIGVEYTVDIVDMFEEDGEVEVDSRDGSNLLLPLHLCPFRSGDPAEISKTTAYNSSTDDRNSATSRKRSNGGSRKRTIADDETVPAVNDVAAKKSHATNRIVTNDGAAVLSELVSGSAQDVIELESDEEDHDPLKAHHLRAPSVDRRLKGLRGSASVSRKQLATMGAAALSGKDLGERGEIPSQLGVPEGKRQSSNKRIKEKKKKRKRHREDKKLRSKKTENQISGCVEKKARTKKLKVVNANSKTVEVKPKSGKAASSAHEVIELPSHDEEDALQSGLRVYGKKSSVISRGAEETSNHRRETVSVGVASLRERSSGVGAVIFDDSRGKVRAANIYEMAEIKRTSPHTTRAFVAVKPNSSGPAKTKSSLSLSKRVKAIGSETAMTEAKSNRGPLAREVIEIASDDEAFVLETEPFPPTKEVVQNETDLHCAAQASKGCAHLGETIRVTSPDKGSDDRGLNLSQYDRAPTSKTYHRMQCRDLAACKSAEDKLCNEASEHGVTKRGSENIMNTPNEAGGTSSLNSIEVALDDEVQLLQGFMKKTQIGRGDSVGQEKPRRTKITPIGVEYTVDVLDLLQDDNEIASRDDHNLLIPLHLYPFRSHFCPAEINPRMASHISDGNSETNQKRSGGMKRTITEDDTPVNDLPAEKKPRAAKNVLPNPGPHFGELRSAEGVSSVDQDVIELDKDEDDPVETHNLRVPALDRDSKGLQEDEAITSKEARSARENAAAGRDAGERGGDPSQCRVPGSKGRTVNNPGDEKRKRQRKRRRDDKKTNLIRAENQQNDRVEGKARTKKRQVVKVNVKNVEIKTRAREATSSAYEVIEVASEEEDDVLQTETTFPEKPSGDVISESTEKTPTVMSQDCETLTAGWRPSSERSPDDGGADIPLAYMPKERGTIATNHALVEESKPLTSRDGMPRTMTATKQGSEPFKPNPTLALQTSKKIRSKTVTSRPQSKESGKNTTTSTKETGAISIVVSDKDSGEQGVTPYRVGVQGNKRHQANNRDEAKKEQKWCRDGKKHTLRKAENQQDGPPVEKKTRTTKRKVANANAKSVMVQRKQRKAVSANEVIELASGNDDDVLQSAACLLGKKSVDSISKGREETPGVPSLESVKIPARLASLSGRSSKYRGVDAVSANESTGSARASKSGVVAESQRKPSVDTTTRPITAAKTSSGPEPAKRKSRTSNPAIKKTITEAVVAEPRSIQKSSPREVVEVTSEDNSHHVPRVNKGTERDATDGVQTSNANEREDGAMRVASSGGDSNDTGVARFQYNQPERKCKTPNAPIVISEARSENVATMPKEAGGTSTLNVVEAFLYDAVDLPRTKSPRFSDEIDWGDQESSLEDHTGLTAVGAPGEDLVGREKPSRVDHIGEEKSGNVRDSKKKPLVSEPEVIDVESDEDDQTIIKQEPKAATPAQPSFSQPNYVLIDMTSDDEMTMTSHAQRPAAYQKSPSPLYHHWVAGSTVPPYRPRYGHQKFFARDKDFTFAKTRQEALEEQERLFSQAAASMHQHQAFLESMQRQRTNSLGCPTFTRAVDLTKLNKDHWKWECPYARLGLPTDVSADVIKKQYRKHALRYHPDKCRLEDASLRFQAVTEAYNKIKGGD